MWNLYEVNATKMKALHDQAVFKMISSLPEEVLNMQVGKFLEASETNPEMAEWANKPFEFSDRYNLVSGPAISSENEEGKSLESGSGIKAPAVSAAEDEMKESKESKESVYESALDYVHEEPPQSHASPDKTFEETGI